MHAGSLEQDMRQQLIWSLACVGGARLEGGGVRLGEGPCPSSSAARQPLGSHSHRLCSSFRALNTPTLESPSLPEGFAQCYLPNNAQGRKVKARSHLLGAASMPFSPPLASPAWLPLSSRWLLGRESWLSGRINLPMPTVLRQEEEMKPAGWLGVGCPFLGACCRFGVWVWGIQAETTHRRCASGRTGVFLRPSGWMRWNWGRFTLGDEGGLLELPLH